MQLIYKTSIIKHSYSNFNNQEELITKYVPASNPQKSLKVGSAAYRLLDILKSRDEDTYRTEEEGIKITRFLKGTKFNAPNETIYLNYELGNRNKEFRLKAIRRLAKYLEKKNPKYVYSGSYIFKKVGDTCYSLVSSAIEYRDIKTKLVIIKRKQSAAKASLTKVINQLKKIKKSYEITLFTRDYKNDKKYIKIFSKLSEKRKKLKASKNLTIADIPTFSKDISYSDQLKILKTLKERA